MDWKSEMYSPSRKKKKMTANRVCSLKSREKHSGQQLYPSKHGCGITVNDRDMNNRTPGINKGSDKQSKAKYENKHTLRCGWQCMKASSETNGSIEGCGCQKGPNKLMKDRRRKKRESHNRATRRFIGMGLFHRLSRSVFMWNLWFLECKKLKGSPRLSHVIFLRGTGI